MRTPLLLAATALTMLALPSAPVASQARPAASVDWTRTIAQTPEGHFRMGNPAARVKLVEYVSLTCPHCAEFGRTGVPALIAGPIRSGRVSFEYRHFVLNAPDVAASLIARCAGRPNYFRLVGHLLATQPQWTGRIGTLREAERNRIAGLEPAARLLAIGETSGLIDAASRLGLPPARARRCLTDTTGFEALSRGNEAAAALGVQGTPTFFINGRLAPAHDWAELAPLLRAAGG